MDRSDVINLVKESYTMDDYGADHKTLTKREVFCSVASVGSAEFFRAFQNNLKAQFKFVIFRFDYDGEKIVEYNGEQYAIYRTFENGDELELYCERKAGTDG